MDSKKWNKIWGVSLVVIGVSTILMTGAQIAAHAAGQPLDVLMRVCGVADLVALPFLGFSTVKKLQNRK